MIDYQGIALVISAATVSAGTLVTIALQIATYRDGRKSAAKLLEVHDMVNGMTEAKVKAAEDAGKVEGKALGIRTERADPHANPAPKKPIT